MSYGLGIERDTHVNWAFALHTNIESNRRRESFSTRIMCREYTELVGRRDETPLLESCASRLLRALLSVTEPEHTVGVYVERHFRNVGWSWSINSSLELLTRGDFHSVRGASVHIC